jgi:hypothetical protein
MESTELAVIAMLTFLLATGLMAFMNPKRGA